MNRRPSLGKRDRTAETDQPRRRFGSQHDDRYAEPVGTPALPLTGPDGEVLPPKYYDVVEDPHTYLNSVMLEAMAMGASDVLIDYSPQQMLIRARVDSRMRPVRSVPGEDITRLMNIFKSTYGLSTSQSYTPQEASMNLEVDGEPRRVRLVAFAKTTAESQAGGMALVMRLPESGPQRTLEQLGLSALNHEYLRKMLDTRSQMILIAGPMNCGKSTTARAALMHISNPYNTVWTLEDPVERLIPGTIQLSVNEKEKAGYDDLLPHLLRADYDTLFLGEIRDPKTAAAGVRQARAGRQVITTIHATNNVTALMRLINLAGDTPLSVLDSVRGVISQRLVARRNPLWSEGDDPLNRYKGQVPIHEALTITDTMIEAIMAGVPLHELKSIAAANSVSTFAQDLERLVDAGVTDVQEAERLLNAN